MTIKLFQKNDAGRSSKRFARSIGGNIFMTALVVFTGVILGLPLLYAVMAAFKPMEEIFVFPPRFFVRNPTTDNFTDLMIMCSNLWVPFSKYLFNSLSVAVVTTFLNVLVCSACAYPLALNHFPGKKAIFNLIVVALMFVPQVTFLPQYVIIAKMGLIDTWPAMVLPSVATSLGVFLMKQFMEQMPVSVIEAARLDGYNEFLIFFKIIMPNVKPAWLTLTIFSFQGIWNNGSVQSVVFSENLRTLPTVMAQISQGGGIARVGVSAAATVFLMLPPIILFVLLQSKVVETMAFAALKE